MRKAGRMGIEYCEGGEERMRGEKVKFGTAIFNLYEFTLC
jgi:hypothetical protein